MNIGDRVIALDPDSNHLKDGYVCGLFPDDTVLVSDNPRFFEKGFYNIRWAMVVPIGDVYPLMAKEEPHGTI